MKFNKGATSSLPFDAVVETRLLYNGVETSRLDCTRRLDVVIANKNTGTNPPADGDQKRLHFALNSASIAQDKASFRLEIVKDCHERFNRGVPISKGLLDEFKKELIDEQDKLDKTLMPGVVDTKGVVNQVQLNKVLPRHIYNLWPKNAKGELRTENSILVSLNNPYAEHLLTIREHIRGRILFEIDIDYDGRHRAWPNPFGTVTGREKPFGWSHVYLPKTFRSIIQPKEGYAIGIIDFQQQEPAILAHLANDIAVLDVYRKGDLYEHFAQHGPWKELCRKQVKELIIAFIYGATQNMLLRQFNIPSATANEWLAYLKETFAIQVGWLTKYVHDAYQSGEVSCLDWRMEVNTQARVSTLKNWSIQAAGADILRRACLGLAAAKIPVIGCMHDSIMVEVPLAGYSETFTLAGKIMADASAEVLDGFRLKTKMEYEAFPAIAEASGAGVSMMEFSDEDY